MLTRRNAIGIAAAGMLALLAGPGSAASPEGTTAPDFQLPKRGGGEVSLAGLRGQVVMVNFWASWCGPCREEFPVLDQLYRKYGPMGFTLLAVNVEPDATDAERFLASTPVSFPIAFDKDGQVAGAYGVSAMPTTVLIDRRGRLRWMHRAYQPGDENEYLDQVRAMLREAP